MYLCLAVVISDAAFHSVSHLHVVKMSFVAQHYDGYVILYRVDDLVWQCPFLSCGAVFLNEADCRSHVVFYHRICPHNLQRLELDGLTFSRGLRTEADGSVLGGSNTMARSEGT